MKVPKGKKNRDVILVEITGDPILYYVMYPDKDPKSNMVDKQMTLAEACVFNTYSSVYSDNSIYRSSKGDYIKKNGRRYYIQDFA